jgi:hypothetical protein
MPQIPVEPPGWAANMIAAEMMADEFCVSTRSGMMIMWKFCKWNFVGPPNWAIPSNATNFCRAARLGG